MNFEKLEEFMLTGKKLANTTFRKSNEKIITNTKFEKNKSKTNLSFAKVEENLNKNVESKNRFIFPTQKDSLFWCFYIMKNGYESYEMLENINIVVERQIKIECVELLRKNKHLIKGTKIAPLTHIENCLVNENKIDVKTFVALCIINKINLLYIHKNTYFLLNCDEIEDNKMEFESFHLVKRTDETMNFGIFLNDSEINEKDNKIKHYVETFYQIENMSKPVKALSSYKVSELADIAKKLGIETTNHATNKQKTKNEIYELIIQYF